MLYPRDWSDQNTIIYQEIEITMRQDRSKAPLTPVRPKTLKNANGSWTDPYYWLREINNPEVLSYLKEENRYTDHQLKSARDSEQKIFAEIKSRLDENEESVPELRGDYWYFYRYHAGQQYPIFYRRLSTGPAEEILDQNKLAEGYDYCDIGEIEASPDGRYLAYSVDFSGQENFVIYFKDLLSGQVLPKKLEQSTEFLEWSSDSQELYFITIDETKRPYRLWRQSLVDLSTQAELLWEETDPLFSLWLYNSSDQSVVFAIAESKTSSELRYVLTDQADRELRLLAPRRQQIKYFADRWHDFFYIRSNDSNTEYRICRRLIETPNLVDWQEVLRPEAGVTISGFDMFNDFLVLYQRANGLKQIRVKGLTNDEDYQVIFPETIYNFWRSSGNDYAGNCLRFCYSSFLTPDTVVDFALTKRLWLNRKQDQLGPDYHPELYRQERIWVTLADSQVAIPVLLVYRLDLFKPKTNPLVLYTYGAYGATEDANFSHSLFSLLDRGIIYAVAQVRGGGELGVTWYLDGKLEKKNNSIDDYLACARYLIEQGYSEAGRIVAHGASAGGLIVSAAVNRYPELFVTLLAEVPFVDVLTTMADPSLPLTIGEYEEWGNPDEVKYFNCIKKYSPYDNVISQTYPTCLLTGALNDPRVAYWEPAKMVARLRSSQRGQAPILLKTNLDAGHCGASGRYDFWQEVAFVYSFILWSLNLEQQASIGFKQRLISIKDTIKDIVIKDKIFLKFFSALIMVLLRKDFFS